MLRKLIHGANVLRYNEWWRTKVPFLLGIWYWQLAAGGAFYPNWQQLALNIFLLVLWIAGAAGFGYFINDCFDIEQDREAGKANRAATMSIAARWALGGALFIIALLPWIFLQAGTLLWVLVVAHLLSFFTYSMPPLRFKERYYLGVLNDAWYAFYIPVIIVALAGLAYLKVDWRELWHIQSLALWALVAGLRNIMQHHLLDREKDRRSGTKNVANRFGLRLNVNIIRFALLPAELLLFVVCVFETGVAPLTVLAGFLFFCCLELLPVVRVNLRHRYHLRFDLGLFTMNRFYEEYLPLVILAIMAIANPWWWLAFVLHQLIFPNMVLRTLVSLTYHHIVLKWAWLVRLILSRIVNYSIHYTRILLGITPKKTAPKEHDNG